MGGKRGVLKFCQRDVARAFRAAKSVGIAVRVDISKDGGLSIVPIVDLPQGVNPADNTIATDTKALRSWD